MDSVEGFFYLARGNVKERIMIIDVGPKSSGQYHVYATYRGSYGETGRQRKGRAFADFTRACNKAAECVRRGALDAEVVDTHSRESWWFTRSGA